MRKIFPIFAILVGLYWIWGGFEYGLWVRRGPGGGFFPLIGGLLTVIFSASYLWDELKNPKESKFDPRFLYPILAILGVLVGAYVIGLLPSMLLFIFFWLKAYEKYSLRFSLGVSLGTMFVVYMVFVFWLSVQMPAGIVGNSLSNWWYGI